MTEIEKILQWCRMAHHPIHREGEQLCIRGGDWSELEDQDDGNLLRRIGANHQALLDALVDRSVPMPLDQARALVRQYMAPEWPEPDELINDRVAHACTCILDETPNYERAQAALFFATT